MLSKINFITLSVLTGFTVTSFATSTNNINTTPSPSNVDISVAALWLAPSANNLNYAILNKALPLLQPSWNEQQLDPAFSPAFQIGLSYAFPNSDEKDIALSWLHLNTGTTSATVTAD